MRLMITGFLIFFVLPVFAKNVFSGVTRNLGACYSRTYEKDHLLKKKDQTVTHIAAKVYYKKFTTDSGDEIQYPYLKVQAKRRLKNGDKDPKVYGTDMLCQLNIKNEKGIYCHVDTCDGPGVYVRFSTIHQGSLLIDNSEFRLSLEPMTCDDPADAELANIVFEPIPGGDDIFRVDPMQDFHCL